MENKNKLSKKNIKKIVFGGVYVANPSDIEKYYSKYTDGLNDQRYGWWIPTHSIDRETGEDKYYMIDTYQISGDLYENKYSSSDKDRYNGLLKGLEKLEEAENGGNWASRMPYNYYYSAIIRLTDENIDIFKLKADLHEYRMSNQDECRNYSEEDVIHCLRLYNEHCYSSGGIVIVKNDAKINYTNKINAKISDIWKDIDEPYSCGDYKVKELLEIEKEAVENNQKYNKKKLDAIIKYNNFISSLKELHDKYKEAIKEELYSD